MGTFFGPTIQDWTPVKELNRALVTWGYTEHLVEFKNELDSELTRMLLLQSDRASWVRGREQWIIEGDALLDRIQDILFGTFMDSLSLHETKSLWISLTGVAYKVMYMITALEARWDMYLH